MKLSLPSFEALWQNLLQVLKRFPLEILFALGGTWAAIQTTLPGHDGNDSTWLKLIMCGNLGLVFSLSASTFSENLNSKRLIIWALRSSVIVLAAVYFFTFPEYLRSKDYYRFFLLAATGHLLVSVAPFSARGHINDFWHYNKSLFLRFLTAVLYSAVLFAGLSVALLALDELFGVEIKGELYWRLWLLIAGIFNTIMFLAGVPLRPLHSGEGRTYPKALKIFTEYVLIPLVSIYVLILLAYELKIFVMWDLPRGWVSNLIIAFAVFGILSLLLVFPIRNTSGNKWIFWYRKAFYWIMLPLLGLLFLAIGTRIADYGFTAERFIVLITGCWLVFLAFYFLFGKKENIKLIPSSLLAVTLVSVTVAFPLSAYSQKKRMLGIFARYGMLKGANVIAPSSPPADADRRELTSIVRYLYTVHGSSPFRHHFSNIPDSLPDGRNTYRFTDSLFSSIQIDPMYSNGSAFHRYFNVSMENDHAVSTKGFDFYLIGEESYSQAPKSFRAGGHTIEEHIDAATFSASLIIDHGDTIRFNLDPLVTKLAERYRARGEGTLKVGPEEVSLEQESPEYKVRFYLKRLSGSIDRNGIAEPSSLSVRAAYLITFK